MAREGAKKGQRMVRGAKKGQSMVREGTTNNFQRMIREGFKEILLYHSRFTLRRRQAIFVLRTRYTIQYAGASWEGSQWGAQFNIFPTNATFKPHDVITHMRSCYKVLKFPKMF